MKKLTKKHKKNLSIVAKLQFAKGRISWSKGKHWKMSKETKRKISIITKGDKNPFYGKKHTKKFKEKMSKMYKGRKLSKITKTRISRSHTGKHFGLNNNNWKGGKTLRSPSRPKTEQCEICGALGTICYDHDHSTGKFRGWICLRCNFALGMVKDSKELLKMLINYLNKNNHE